jgi:bifunctional non-homologous end joining protein LigD
LNERSEGSRDVTITHPDRVLFPADGITKADLAAYHHAVAEHLVRHLADRPLMLQRFPEGIDGQGFYQKAVGPGIPD